MLGERRCVCLAGSRYGRKRPILSRNDAGLSSPEEGARRATSDRNFAEQNESRTRDAERGGRHMLMPRLSFAYGSGVLVSWKMIARMAFDSLSI